MNEVTQQAPSSEGTAKVVYILYLAGIIFGLTGIIGVVMAYINKREAPDWLQTHYQFQIRTFWIGLLYVLIGMVSSVILIGYLVLLFWVVWLVIRCVKGMKSLDQKEAHPDPASWLF
ncbi:MAG: DUF4870 family protein [Cycloclasticus sp.]